MSATRDTLWRILSSRHFRDVYGSKHPIDYGKVIAEWTGQRRPLPREQLALGLVNLIRANPKPAGPLPPAETIFNQQGALTRHPQGGVEDIVRYRNAGLKWLLWNLEYTASQWATVRTRCDALGIPHGPWYHARNTADLDRLLDAAMGHRLVGINVEYELETTLSPAVIAQHVQQAVQAGLGAQVCTILLGWVQNNADCRPISGYPALLELFPQDAPFLFDATTGRVKWEECKQHAVAQGVAHPLLLAQCYGNAKPAWYGTWPRSCYTLDDCSPTIEAWL